MPQKETRRQKIKTRVRAKIRRYGRASSPDGIPKQQADLCQVINDVDGVTIASASSLKLNAEGTKKEIAALVGTEVAKAAQAAGVSTVVFDRNGYLYHGRVKELADAARAAGLNF